MRIDKVRIRNFRSIQDISISIGNIVAIVGENSSGKSNIVKAIEYAFMDNIAATDVYKNLPAHLRAAQGGPRLSTYIDITLRDLPQVICDEYTIPHGDPVIYSFRAIRSGTVTRKLGTTELDDEFSFNNFINIISVPAIRDLAAGGMKPFQELFGAALQRARGANNIEQHTTRIKTTLQQRGDQVLSYHRNLAEDLIGVGGLSVDSASIILDDVFSLLPIQYEKNGVRLPLETLGTGHQSAFIMNFFRQLGDADERASLFLFEEPDNHLHPSSVRTIADELLSLSNTSQVMLTTHSPVLVDHFGLKNIVAVRPGKEGDGTQVRKLTLEDRDERNVRVQLRELGLRATEPLFSSLVIMVEGPSDAVVINRIYESHVGRPPLHDGILVLPALSKGKMPQFAELLSKLDIPWRAVFDNDAAWTADAPITKEISDDERANLLRVIDLVAGVINSNNRRGKKACGDMDRIKNELQYGRPAPTALTGTPLEKLLNIKKDLTRDEMRELKRTLSNRQIRRTRDLLAKAGVWVWQNGAIEAALLSGTNSVQVTRDFMRENRIAIPAGSTPENIAEIGATLKKQVLSDSLLAQDYVDYGYANGLFNRGEVSRNFLAFLKLA